MCFMTAGGLEPCFLSVIRQTWIWNYSAGIPRFLFKCDWELIRTNIGNEDTRAKLHVILRCFGSIKDYNLVVSKVDLSNITWVLIIEYRRFPYLFPCCSQQNWWMTYNRLNFHDIAYFIRKWPKRTFCCTSNFHTSTSSFFYCARGVLRQIRI